MGRKILYIAGPYRGPRIIDVKRNIRRADEAMETAWTAGWLPVCPHLNSAFIDGLVPDSEILPAYIDLMKRCDAVWFLPGWSDSEGCQAEYRVAIRCGLRIIKSLQ